MSASVTEQRFQSMVLVDLELCKACGVCITLCPTDVFDTDTAGQAVAARPEDCTVCRLCEWHCPDFAIEVIAREASRSEAPRAAGTATVAATAEEDA